MNREHDPLERYLDDFASRLRAADAAPTRPRRRRRRVAVAAASAVVAAVAAVVLLAGPGGGDRLDVVAEARAALSPRGEIVHMVIRAEAPPDDAGTPPPHVTEQWTAVDPPRWRVVQVLPRPGEGRGTVGDAQGPIFGRQEFAYAGGVQRVFTAQRNTLVVQKGFSDDGPAAQAPGLFGMGGDPQADLRAMLASGEVTDTGERRVDGRTVRRLVSETSRDTFRRRLVYDVDADTFAPVQGSLTITLGAGTPQARDISTRFVVERYERIPITPQSAKLLTITTNPDTKVTVRTAEDLRRRQEGPLPPPAAPRKRPQP